MTTRQRLISLGLIRPHTIDAQDRAISMAKAIASRRIEVQRSVPVVQKRSINISLGRAV